MGANSCLSCVSLFVLTISVASAQEARHGTVTDVDEATSSITIQQADGASNSQKSSDRFVVKDGLLFNAIRSGDKVKFTSEEVGGKNTIRQLQKE